jgi:DNA-binding transcriptional MerR regulator
VNRDGLLKMSELAERSGVSSGTIKHYLREGLLGSEDDGIVRTSRNMAYYPPELVDRIRRIKQLQKEGFLPLKIIREHLEADLGEQRVPVGAVDDVPRKVLDRLAELDVLTPTDEGYDADDLRIIDAMRRFRAGGYDESIGFTVYDTVRYREALQPLVEEEIRELLPRLADGVAPDRALELLRTGAEPLRELIGAVHSKLLLAELRRRLEAGPPPPPAAEG